MQATLEDMKSGMENKGKKEHTVSNNQDKRLQMFAKFALPFDLKDDSIRVQDTTKVQQDIVD